MLCHSCIHVQNVPWKCLFFTFATIVQAALLMKCLLSVIRQLSPHVFLPQACRINGSDNSIGQQYVFTMIVYSIVFVGRWLETLIIHIHTYKFFFSQSTIAPDQFKHLCSKGLKRSYAIRMLLMILTVYMLIHSGSIPLLGVILEIQTGQKTDCEGYVYQYHVVYWLLDIIRYLNDVAIRILMVLATIVIGELWMNYPPEDTDNQLINGPKNEEETKDIAEYLQDRDVTNKDHEMRTKRYAERGSQVERIVEIFQTWFPIPWLLYFTATSLDTDHILKAWKDGSSGEGHYDFSEISYMVYNFNQLSLLAIAFLCSKRMNTYHRNYFAQSRHLQVTKFKTASRMAMANMNKIEKDEHFDFVPRFWGTSIKVPVESSLYIVTMLVGIFFTVCEALI